MSVDRKIQKVADANRHSGGKLAYCTTVTFAGDTTLITPAAGKRLEVYWVYAISRVDLDPPLMKFFFQQGASTSMEFYRVYALSHWELFTGAVNESLKVNLSSSGNIAVTIHYKEIT